MKQKDPAILTTGNPARRIVIFALPIFAGDFLHVFYTMADTFIVGRWLGINALASAGMGTSVVHFIFSVIIGLSAGFTVITAQRVGALSINTDNRNAAEEGIRRSVAAGLSLSLFTSVTISILSLFLAKPLLVLMNTPAEIIDNAHIYVLIISTGIGVFMFYFLLTGIIHAGGDSFTPLIFLIIGSVTNIALDLLFVAVLSWGVPGAAAATVLAELFALILIILFIFRRFRSFLPRKQDWRGVKGEWGAHLSLGIAMALQRCIVEVGNLLVQAAINGLGALTIAAVSAAQRVRGFNMTPLFSVSRAVTTYTAQNYGAGKMDRVYKGLFQACMISLGLGAFMAILNQFTGTPIVALFLKDSPEAIALASQYILYTGYTVFILGIMLAFRSCLQGLGMRRVPILCGVMETVMSVLAALVLIPRFGFTGVCLVNPLSWLASGIPLYIAFWILWKRNAALAA